MRIRFAAPNESFHYSFATDHLWYSVGRKVWRRCLKTHVDELIRVVGADISGLGAQDTYCVIAMSDVDGTSLYTDRLFAWGVAKWIATPKRVVFQTRDLLIMAYDVGSGAYSKLAEGYLHYASDLRIMYGYYNGIRWQDGERVAPDEDLLPNDEVRKSNGIILKSWSPYWIARVDDAIWLMRESPTTARIREVVNALELAAWVLEFT